MSPELFPLFAQFDNTLLIHCKTDQSDKVQSVEINVNSFVSDTVAEPNVDKIFRNLDGLINLLKTDVVGKLIPSGESSSSIGTGTGIGNNSPHRFIRSPPVRPPGFNDDDYDLSRPQPPFGVGSGDVYPNMPGIPGMGGPPGSLIGPSYFDRYPPGVAPFPARGPGRNPGGPIPPGERCG
jgi:hypothetical protein